MSRLLDIWKSISNLKLIVKLLGLLSIVVVVYYFTSSPSIFPSSSRSEGSIEVNVQEKLIDDRTQRYEPVVDLQDTNLLRWETESELIEKIQKNWLQSPSNESYNFTLTPNDYKEIKRMHRATLKLLNYKKNGFFLEAGGYNGIALSNTLHLEMDYNWTGLLIEADPKYFKMLQMANRKCWIINACIGIHPYPHKVQMTRISDQDALSRIKSLAPDDFLKMPKAEEFESQCFPLISILAATLRNQPLVIDYLSLDIEEAELDVLSTVPFDYIYIKVMTVETRPAADLKITRLLESRNFRKVGRFEGTYVYDSLYVNRRFLRERA